MEQQDEHPPDLLTAHAALSRAVLWAVHNPHDDLAGPCLWQAVDEFLEALHMRKELDNPTQLNTRIEADLKNRLIAESKRAGQSLSVMLREWLTADLTAAEKARGILPAPVVPAEPPTSTPEAEQFTVSTMGAQSPPFTNGSAMPSIPAVAGPVPVPPRLTAADGPGPQAQPQPPQQEDTNGNQSENG